MYIVRMLEPVMHDAEAKKAMDSRLARIEGQVRAVRRMIGEDEPCESIAQQLAAARKALDRAFYEMVSCMIRQEPPAGSPGRSERAGRVAELLARFG
jgi:DNA-binding FrmR family transcriptional regulator